MESTSKTPSAENAARAPLESLGPGRLRPTSVDELMQQGGEHGEHGQNGQDRPDVRLALEQIETAFRVHFPNNIFLDLDLLAAGLFSKTPEEVREVGDLVADLAEQFGGRPIQFRYTHDFLYGFDWQKWVQASPEVRTGIGPFDATFLRWLLDRAGELRALIAQDDHKYNQIDESIHRNPFPFSRSSEDERRLFLELARRHLLPVETYARNGRTRANMPFYRLREGVAAELGILDPNASDRE